MTGLRNYSNSQVILVVNLIDIVSFYILCIFAQYRNFNRSIFLEMSVATDYAIKQF